MIVAGFLIVNGPSQGGVRGVLVRAESSDRYRNYALTLQRSNSDSLLNLQSWLPLDVVS